MSSKKLKIRKLRKTIETFNSLINKLANANTNFSSVLPNFKYVQNDNKQSFIKASRRKTI